MKRKESKIPLLVTLGILGYFVFWAIGYVARNKPQPAAQPTNLQRPAMIADVKPDPVEVQSSQAPPPPMPEIQPVRSSAPVSDQPKVSATDNNDVDVVSNRPVQNRKIMGLIQDSTAKH